MKQMSKLTSMCVDDCRIGEGLGSLDLSSDPLLPYKLPVLERERGGRGRREALGSGMALAGCLAPTF